MTVTQPEAECVWPYISSYEAEKIAEAEVAGVWDAALQLASATLERLTAFQVTNCPVVVRPCSRQASMRAPREVFPYAGVGMSPVNWNGQWYNACSHLGRCDCSSSCELVLPPPVGKIIEVRANGNTIEPYEYQLQSGNILVYTGGGDCPFNIDQDVSKPLSDEGTLGVKYLNGYPVDETASLMVTILALEFAHVLNPASKGKCRLPSNVTSITRSGMTAQLVARVFTEGTGITEVDAWISVWNPKKRTRRASVYSPDLPRHRVHR